MASATLTSKGQITVPKPVRDALGVHPGDRLAFRVRDDGSILVEAETVDLMALRGVVKTTVRGVSIDAMNKAIREAATAKKP